MINFQFVYHSRVINLRTVTITEKILPQISGETQSQKSHFYLQDKLKSFQRNLQHKYNF